MAARVLTVCAGDKCDGIFDRLYQQSPVRLNMRYVPLRLKKRRSTAALVSLVCPRFDRVLNMR